jgi:hypothetical protein
MSVVAEDAAAVSEPILKLLRLHGRGVRESGCGVNKRAHGLTGRDLPNWR